MLAIMEEDMNREVVMMECMCRGRAIGTMTSTKNGAGRAINKTRELATPPTGIMGDSGQAIQKKENGSAWR